MYSKRSLRLKNILAIYSRDQKKRISRILTCDSQGCLRSKLHWYPCTHALAAVDSQEHSEICPRFWAGLEQRCLKSQLVRLEVFLAKYNFLSALGMLIFKRNELLYSLIY